MVDAMDAIRKHPVPLFIVLSFSIAWTLWYFAGAYREITINYSPLGHRWLLAQIGVYAPALSAVLVGWLTQRNSALAQPRFWILCALVLAAGLIASRFDYRDIFTNTWMGVGLVVVAALAVIVFLRIGPLNHSGQTANLAPGIEWILLAIFAVPAVMIFSMLLASGRISLSTELVGANTGLALLALVIIVFSFNLLLGGSVGEEPGWRGFVLPLLLENYRPLGASVILGLLWALFHAPIDISHGFILSGLGSVVARIIWTIPLTYLFTYFYLRTNGSLLIAILLHTSINFSFEFFQPSGMATGIFSAATGLFFIISLISNL